MRKPVMICQRCGSPTREPSTIEASAGPLMARLPRPTRLCPSCADRLADLVRGFGLAAEDSIGGAMQATAVSSMRLAGARA